MEGEESKPTPKTGEVPETGDRAFFGQDFYEMLFMNANVWIAFIDEKSRIKSWNKAAERISGYTAEEVTGSNDIWKKLYPDPGYRKVVTGKIIETISNKKSLDKFETKIRDKEGKTHIISWNTKEILDSSGELHGYFIIGLDITDIVQLQTNFHAILMNANVWIAFIDPVARILVWNRFAEQLTGYTADEVTGSNDIWKKLYPDPGYRKFITSEIQKILRSEKSFEMFESEILTKSGTKKAIFWNTKAIYDYEKNLTGFIVIGLDVTRDKEMQAEIFDYIGQAAVRLKYPVEIIKDNLLELHEKILNDDIDRENALLQIKIQVKNSDQILENLYELNQAVKNSFKEMPDDMKKFLSE